MTLPDERYRALQMVRHFLVDLLDPKATPKVPKYVRTRAYRVLKHYPTAGDIDRLAVKTPFLLKKEKTGK